MAVGGAWVLLLRKHTDRKRALAPVFFLVMLKEPLKSPLPQGEGRVREVRT